MPPTSRPPAELPERKTRTSLSSDDIYDRVKEMAAKFVFRPNERINEIELSKALSVSRTPLREVLNRLMVEGFLTREQNKGFVARSLNPQEILDLYEFRRGIETSLVPLACERATDGQIDELERFARESDQVAPDEDAGRLVELDEEFHLRLARLSGNPEYVRALENVNARIHYVRWIDMQQRRPSTQAEHDEVIQALRRRSVADVTAILDRHIARRLEQITDVVKSGYAEIYTRANGRAGVPGVVRR